MKVMTKPKRKPVAAASPPPSWLDRVLVLQAKLGLTNELMAERLGVSLHTLLSWKYRKTQRREPSRLAQEKIVALERLHK